MPRNAEFRRSGAYSVVNFRLAQIHTLVKGWKNQSKCDKMKQIIMKMKMKYASKELVETARILRDAHFHDGNAEWFLVMPGAHLPPEEYGDFVERIEQLKTNVLSIREMRQGAETFRGINRQLHIRVNPREFESDVETFIQQARRQSRMGKSLKSIHLATNSLEPHNAIFLILDERFESPIRCKIRNDKGGITYIRKLYNIAYFVDVPDKKVSYKKNLASDINNGLFKITQVAKYMKTNGLKKPTLVQKSGDGTLVLKNEIIVKTMLVKHIPAEYQSLYADKTK